MSAAIRVVVVDDDDRVRNDFRRLLELEPDIDVIGTVSDGGLAVEFCDRHEPDVVVMDIRMPGMSGIDATKLLRERHDATCRVLVMTTFDLDEYVLGAVRAGASGFVLKQQAPDLLASAVRTIAAGDAIVAPRATARLLAELVSQQPVRDRGALSDRELDVVQLIAQGLSNEEIAASAFIARSTVKTHVSNILTKLGLTSRLQIVVWAYDNGWGGPPTQTTPER